MKKYFTILFFLFLSLRSSASHIVGGEMLYDYLGNDKYRITLKIYRDCNVTSGFDGIPPAGPAYITVYSGLTTVQGVYDIGLPVVTPVPPAFSNPCIETPNTTCIEEGVYVYTLTLAPIAGGYTIVYQRCCRNAGIVNMVNSESEGSSYYTKIPGPEDAPTNNSPRFDNFPPIYICNGVNFVLDHSATDPDNDQLVYSMCAPYTGMDGCCPSISITAPPTAGQFCPSPPAMCPQVGSPPPYSTVLFSAPYSGSYPIASNPAFSINPVTGQLSGTPTLIAQYVVGICVQEYRNNVLLNTHFRDFQFTVLGCTVNVQSAVADQKQQCQGKTITFDNQSINNSSSPIYHWDFGVPSIAMDTSNIVDPIYTYPDTGIYMLSLVTNPGSPCTDTLKKAVYVYPPLKINFKHADRQCFTNNSFSFSVNGDYATQATFHWDFTSSSTPSTSTLKNLSNIHFTQAGLYFVELRAMQFACRDSFIDSVRVLKKPFAKINNLQSGLCDPATIGFSNGSTADLPLNYKWTFSNGESSTDFEPTQVFSPAGLYSATLLIETNEYCKDTAMHQITNILVNPTPVASFTISPRETSIFEPDIKIKSFASQDVISTYFTFGDGHSSSLTTDLHTYTDFGTYRISQIVKNPFGCVDSTSDVVKILPEFRFWIPNSFTPDDNSRNDFFMPSTFGISLFEFEIFNRWGQKIFSTHNPEEGWNGSYKGKECEQGIYIWKISFKNLASEQKETHLGHVTLIRNP